MQIEDKSNKENARDLAWKMFQKTGNVGYYLLHKDLTE